MSVPHRRGSARGYRASPEQPTVEKWGKPVTCLPLEPQKSWEGKPPLVYACVLEGYTHGRRFTYGFWLQTPLDQLPQPPVFNKTKASQVPGNLAYFSSGSDITVCYFSFLHHFLQFVNTKMAFLPSLLWRVKARDCGFEAHYGDSPAWLVTEKL